MRANRAVVLILAIVMGAGAALWSRQWLVTHGRATAEAAPVGAIVVASKALAFGAELTPQNIVEIPWAAKAMPQGAFVTVASLLKDGGRVVLSPLEPNEPVLRSKISEPGQRASLSALLEEGMRAVTVRVDDVRGVAGFIRPGDLVDVVLIGENPTARRENYSEILLQSIKVLAVDQLASERQEQPIVPKAVTLEVTPEQAQKILLATNVGHLSLTLRRSTDAKLAAARRVTESDLGEFRPRVERAAAPPPPPPTPVVAPPPAPTNTVAVAIIRNMKREEYMVWRGEARQDGR